MSKTVIVKHGTKGWGGPLTLEPTTEKNVVASITGGGIHPVAKKLLNNWVWKQSTDLKKKWNQVK